MEELYAELDCDHLELDDIQMSAALVKETLKKVYESKSNEILETILENPRKSIPVVLKRLYKVYKDNLLQHRQHKKAWRNIVDQCYFKAYDTRGVAYKKNEKTNLSLKHIQSESQLPYSITLNDHEILDFIFDLFILYTKNNTGIANKKMVVERIDDVVLTIFNNLKETNINTIIDFTHNALYYFYLYAL